MLPYGARGTPLQEFLPFHEDPLMTFPYVRPRHIIKQQSRKSGPECCEDTSPTEPKLHQPYPLPCKVIVLDQMPLMAFDFQPIPEPDFSWVGEALRAAEQDKESATEPSTVKNDELNSGNNTDDGSSAGIEVSGTASVNEVELVGETFNAANAESSQDSVEEVELVGENFNAESSQDSVEESDLVGENFNDASAESSQDSEEESELVGENFNAESSQDSKPVVALSDGVESSDVEFDESLHDSKPIEEQAATFEASIEDNCGLWLIRAVAWMDVVIVMLLALFTFVLMPYIAWESSVNPGSSPANAPSRLFTCSPSSVDTCPWTLVASPPERSVGNPALPAAPPSQEPTLALEGALNAPSAFYAWLLSPGQMSPDWQPLAVACRLHGLLNAAMGLIILCTTSVVHLSRWMQSRDW